MITIHKAVLSSATLSEIRDQVEELARGPGGNAAAVRLRDLAVELAAHRDLRVSVITYEDGTEELEVLHAGPPHLNPLGDPAARSRAAGPRSWGGEDRGLRPGEGFAPPWPAGDSPRGGPAGLRPCCPNAVNTVKHRVHQAG